MKTEDWINEAFKDAQRDAAKTEKVARKISELVEEHSNTIFDRWSEIIGFQQALSFADKISRNEADAYAMKMLMHCFAIAGYVLAKTEEKQSL